MAIYKVGFVLEGKSDRYVIPTLVKRLVQNQHEQLTIQEDFLQSPKKGHGFISELANLNANFRSRGAHCVVAVVDSSSSKEHVYREKFEQVARQATDTPLAFVPLAYGIAVHEMEAWLLADQAALKAVTRGDLRRMTWVDHPESIPDPKEYLAKIVFDMAGKNLPFADYAQIWVKEVDLKRLKQRCPHFADFADRLLQVIDTFVKQHGPTP